MISLIIIAHLLLGVICHGVLTHDPKRKIDEPKVLFAMCLTLGTFVLLYLGAVVLYTELELFVIKREIDRAAKKADLITIKRLEKKIVVLMDKYR